MFKVRFFRDDSGNFGMIAALLVLPIMLAAGGAIDMTRLQAAKSQLDAAADAAVLSALSPSSPTFEKAILMAGDGKIEGGEALIERVAKANLLNRIQLDDVEIDPKLTKTGNVLVSEIEYSADVQMHFGGLFGKKVRTVTGKVRAETAIGAPIDFYMLLDNTPSMGVGATPRDIQTLLDNTGNGGRGDEEKCAFACHQMDKANNYYNLAKSLGVKMRIDVVRHATQRLTERAKKVRQTPDQFRMAVYSFGKRAEAMGFTEVAPLTGDLDSVSAKTDALDLMTIPTKNFFNDQLTSFDDTLKSASKEIPAKGTDGKSDRRQILFFVSDGVADSYKPYGCTKRLTKATRCQEPIDVKYCEKLKKRDVEIAVLYTTYLPLWNNEWYRNWIQPFSNEIAPKMKECASPGFFFEVSLSEGIEEAMEALFMKTVSQPRLTN
ncbi:pilus assembly protein TadG-related protein [Fulvimarina sp. MAC8]|uniref:TadE/TadG family type IV pilus assembly protein n=1 Tax=Fulvimarina sp. MAC8 TaxID=3162874 RepID=UPI0032EDF024